MKKTADFTEIDHVLDDWVRISKFIMDPKTTETQCQKLLSREKSKRKRRSIMERVHSNYARRRYLRERAELVALANPAPR